MTRDVAVQRLSRRKERGVHDDVHRVGDVRVGEHDRRILAAHLELHTRAALCRLDRDLTARPFRARERDRLHVGVRDDLVPDLRPGTGDEVERSLRDTRFAERFDQTQRTERRQIRRLQHDSVAADQRRRHLPRRDRDWKVPGRDQSDDAKRATPGLDEDAVPLGRNIVAAEPRALSTDEPKNVDRAADFAPRFRERLPLLARHLARDLIGSRLEDVGGPVEDLAALGRRQRRPGRLRGPGGRNGLPRVVRVRLLKRSDDLARVGRIPVLERGAATCRDPLAPDEILESH